MAYPRALTALAALATLVVTLDCANPSAGSNPSVEGIDTAHASERVECADLLANPETTLPGVTIPWRAALLDYAKENVKHSAWGFPHSARDLLLSLRIARAENLTVDEDVLFAAALLHDLGGLAGFVQPNVDHAVRSAELASDILLPRGFPAEKVDKVKEVILAHTYYNHVPPTSPEAIVFRDADVLDFLGAIGFARIATLTGHETTDLTDSVGLSKSLDLELPPKLLTPSAQCNGQKRAAYLTDYLKTLRAESLDGRFL